MKTENKNRKTPQIFKHEYRTKAGKEESHGSTAFQRLAYFSKRTWKPTLGKERDGKECSAPGWPITNNTRQGGSRTPAPALMGYRQQKYFLYYCIPDAYR